MCYFRFRPVAYDASDKPREPCQLPVIGEVPDQRLLGARGLRTQGGAGGWVRGPGGDQLRDGGDSPPPALIPAGRLRLQPHPLPAAAGAQDGSAGPGGAPGRGWELPEEFSTLRRLLESRMGKRGKREFVQVLRLMENFRKDEVHEAVKDALRLGALSFDAIKHLLLSRIEGRPP